MKFYTVGLAGLCLILAVLDVNAADIPVAERPQVKTGDVFEYADRFETVACKRWEVEALDIEGAMQTRCAGNTAFYTADGALVRIVGRDGKDLVKFTPQSAPIPFPLRLGAKWSGSFAVTTADDLISPNIKESCEATAYESVKVPAGELPAFRVMCKDTWSVGILTGESTSTYWYAPAARAVVKVVSSGDDKWNLELARYSFR